MTTTTTGTPTPKPVSSSAKLFEELTLYLNHQNVAVRQKASETIFQFTSSDAGIFQLLNSNLPLHLLALIGDPDPTVRYNIVRILINLSGSEQMNTLFAKRHVIEEIIEILVANKESKVAESYAMLLSNISQSSRVCSVIAGIPDQPPETDSTEHSQHEFYRPTAKQGYLLSKILLHLLFACRKHISTNQPINIRFLALVVANLSQLDTVCNFMVIGPVSTSNNTDTSTTEVKYDTNSHYLKLLDPQFLNIPDSIVRGGLISLVRNISFRRSLVPYLFHSKSPSFIGDFDSWFGALSNRLRIWEDADADAPVGKNIGSTDSTWMNQVLLRNPHFETIPELRKRICDCFWILSTTPVGRKVLYRHSCYKLLRNLHQRETDELVEKPLVNCVENLIRMMDEAEEDDAAQAQAKGEAKAAGDTSTKTPVEELTTTTNSDSFLNEDASDLLTDSDDDDMD